MIAGAPRARRHRRGALTCALCAVVASALEMGRVSWVAPPRAAPAPRPGAGYERPSRRQVGMRQVGTVYTGLQRGPVLTSDLDDQQREAIERVLNGKNVFLTGGAGTGKTFTLNAVIGMLEQKYGREDFAKKVVVTASTGTAAVLCDGCTLHHIAGIGVPFEVNDFTIDGLFKSLWTTFEVLVIDEVSMISGEFLDLFEAAVRKVRNNDKPFGGLQVVLVGDPFQLPPVEGNFWFVPRDMDPDEIDNNRVVFDGGKREMFLNRGMFFQSKSFWDSNFTKVELQTAHRQDGKDQYYKCLTCIRQGGPDDSTLKLAVEMFNEKCRRVNANSVDEGIVSLVPTVVEAQEINDEKLAELDTTGGDGGADERTFLSKDTVTLDGALDAMEDFTAEVQTDLLEFMRTAEFFCDSSSHCPVPQKVTLKRGARVMLVANMPDMEESEKLVNGICGTVTFLSPRNNLIEVDWDELGPIPIGTHEFKMSMPCLGELTREQIPVKLAWALTHHKSQGKTIPRARVNPGAFAAGQSYVALSRTPDFDSLELTAPFRFSQVIVTEEVKTFMETYTRESIKEFWDELPLPENVQEHVRLCSEQAEALAWGWE